MRLQAVARHVIPCRPHDLRLHVPICTMFNDIICRKVAFSLDAESKALCCNGGKVVLDPWS